MGLLSGQKKTYPRTAKIMKVGREWIEAEIVVDNKIAKAKIQISDQTKEFEAGMTIKALMSYVSAYGASPVKYRIASNLQIIDRVFKTDSEKAFEASVDAAVKKWRLARTRMSTRQWGNGTVQNIVDRILADEKNPGKIVEVTEVNGVEMTYTVSRNVRQVLFMAPCDGLLTILTVHNAPEKSTTEPSKQRNTRFLAEATAQIWDNCPHCRSEPVYMPKLVCENCW